MQERRRSQTPQQLDPTKERIEVPAHYWEDLDKIDMAKLCENALAQAFSTEDLLLTVLGREILVDRKNHTLRQKNQGEWAPMDRPSLSFS